MPTPEGEITTTEIWSSPEQETVEETKEEENETEEQVVSDQV